MDSAPISSSRRDWRFWMVFVCITLSQFLTALELSAVSTALPTIVNDLDGEQFVWIGSAYTICSTAFVPLSGGLAETFGRRIMMFGSLVVFAVGSVVCGAATSMNFLIAGRAVQGLGAGGIASLCHIILSDVVPLKDRGVFNGLIAMDYTVANGIGPVVGGALAQNGQWRWIFYLNAPICGVTAVLVGIFLTLRTPPGTLSEKLGQIDWVGNALVVSATTSTMIGLTWGGVQYPWTSARVLVPLILGLVGLVGFMIFEAMVPKHPIVPYSLMTTRTSLSGFIQTFFLFTSLICVLYYLPVYFQACQDASPIASGVSLFGLAFTVAPAALLVGLSIAKTKAYRPQIWLAWSLAIVGIALLSTLKAGTLEQGNERAKAIGFQVITGFGFGMLTAAIFFPILAPLPVESNAHAISLYTFYRNFANILGVTIGGAVLQNELVSRLPAEFFARFPQGTEVAYAIIPLIPSMSGTLKEEIRVAFGESLQVVWRVCIGITGAGFVSSLAMKAHRVHSETDEKWGLEKTVGDDEEKSPSASSVST